MIKLFWAGDSTVKENDFTTYPQTGIGQGIGLFLKKEVVVMNHAENGRSTKSFLDEARLAPIYDEIREGDFLFIQFGHNDSKDDPSRYTEPYGEFQDNLERFINAARNKKAFPLLITPLCRRWFDEQGNLEDNIHGDYPTACLQVGERLGVPCIDLYRLSHKLLQDEGPEATKKYFMNFEKDLYPNYKEGLLDNTHLRYEGAIVFARLIANELKTIGAPFKDLLKDPDRL